MHTKETQKEDNTSVTTNNTSNEQNDSIETVMYNDKVRYQQKGYGLIMAILIFASYFYFSPILLQKLWPSIIAAGDKKFIMFLFVFGMPVVIIIIGNIMMWQIYSRKISFFERYKIQNKPWPWQEDSQKWRQTLKKSIKQIASNQIFFLLPAILFDIYIMGADKCKWSMEEFPGYIEILSQVTFMMLVEDFSFYWVHRILHTYPYLYKKIHKIHHEYVNSVSISASYAHPIEYVLGNSVPTALGFMILGKHCHFATYILWLVIRLFETIDGHCGYEFSWSPYRLLPLSGSSEYHNYHHSHNVGTFGSFFTFWDTFFGTNKDYFQYKAKKEQELKLNQLRQQHNEKKIN